MCNISHHYTLDSHQTITGTENYSHSTQNRWPGRWSWGFNLVCRAKTHPHTSVTPPCPPSPHNHNAISPSRSSCNFPSTAQLSCKCSLLAPKGGRSAGCTTLCCTKEIIANVFAGDAIFTQECQIPFLQHFFPLFSVRLVIISCPV